MKKLFNKYEAYTTDGHILDNIVYRVLKPIFLEWMEKGFSVRDIENVIHDNTGVISAERRILKAIQMKREGNDEDNND